ncbi:hypothetical protein ACQKI4_25855 [Paenibacillus glucanolyticus]
MKKSVKPNGLKIALYLLLVGVMLYVVVYIPFDCCKRRLGAWAEHL